ncbi:tRNA dimethylallyltransferase [hydrothermal vent metagenome]|uniref:tRNA dimethylallyltransferase n=1 Tax=hydrothermal vent metagenome TaxID=652676 RepID=A0A3B1CFR6_9ZZZZ
MKLGMMAPKGAGSKANKRSQLNMADKLKPPLLILTGPTACGKSDTGVILAEKLETEIISADSVQVYKHFDIGSAKPSQELLRRVKHHLVGIVEPNDEFNVMSFKNRASKVAHELLMKGKIPLVVGGTGLYLKSLMEGLSGGAKISEAVEREIDKIYEKEDQAGVYKRACEADPEWMLKVHPNDTFRTRRALGVFMTSGKTLTQTFKNNVQENLWDTMFIVIDPPRAELYRRIEERADKTLNAEWRNEVIRLKGMGYNDEIKPMRSLGYKTIYDETEGRVSKDDVPRLIKKATKAFARRQLTWFRKVHNAVFIPTSPNETPGEIANRILNHNETRNFLSRHNTVIS